MFNYIIIFILEIITLIIGKIQFILYICNIEKLLNYKYNENNKTLVFIHGSGFNESQWIFYKFYYNYFYNYNVYSFNFNTNYFYNKSNLSIKELTDIFYNYINNINSNEIYLIGHSLGGLIACECLKYNNNKIKKVITIASPIKGVKLLNYISENNSKKIYNDMLENSEFINNLNNYNYNNIVNIGSKYDFIIGKNNYYFDNNKYYELYGGHYSILLNYKLLNIINNNI